MNKPKIDKEAKNGEISNHTNFKSSIVTCFIFILYLSIIQYNKYNIILVIKITYNNILQEYFIYALNSVKLIQSRFKIYRQDPIKKRNKENNK